MAREACFVRRTEEGEEVGGKGKGREASRGTFNYVTERLGSVGIGRKVRNHKAAILRQSERNAVTLESLYCLYGQKLLST